MGGNSSVSFHVSSRCPLRHLVTLLVIQRAGHLLKLSGNLHVSHERLGEKFGEIHGRIVDKRSTP